MQSEPFVIAVFHQKGGVGKTTTVIQLAACRIAKDQHQKTLLIDLDPSGSLTTGLGISASSKLSVVDVLLGNLQVDEVVKPTKYPRLYILPSHPDLALASKYLYTRPNYSSILKDALNRSRLEESWGRMNQRVQLKRELPQSDLVGPPWILIDCPPMISPINIVALTAAKLLLIPIQTEAYSIKALDGVFRLIEAVRKETNPALDYRLFVNMYDEKSKLQNRLLENIRNKFGEYVLDTVVGYEPKIEYAQMAAEPLFAISTNCLVAQNFIFLAQELNTYAKSRILR